MLYTGSCCIKQRTSPHKALSTNMQRETSCELCLFPLALCQCYSKPSQLSGIQSSRSSPYRYNHKAVFFLDGTGWEESPPPHLTMQPDTYCNLCLSSLALCPCYSKLSQRIPSPDFATSEIGTMERPVVASPPYQYFMPDLLSGTQSFYNAVVVALPLPVPEFGEGDMTSPIGLQGHLQPLLLPTDPTISGVGEAVRPPQPVVASPAQVSASNRRRTNPSPRRFACRFCPQDFTAKHNLRS